MKTPRYLTIVIGAFLIFEALLIFAPMAILGAAIDWPGSLDLPASEVLPLIRSQRDAVRVGYGIYLLYSLLWILVGASVARLVRTRDGPSVGAGLLVALATASALARSVGIIRWLTASPALAEIQGEGPEAAAIAETVQVAVNAWGGAIGEALGIGLFAGIWTLVASLTLLRSRAVPAIVALAGFPVGALTAAPSLSLIGVEVIGVVAGTTAIHLWLMAIGVCCLLGLTRNRLSPVD